MSKRWSTLCVRLRPRIAVIADPALSRRLRDGLREPGCATRPHAGADALEELVAGDACDTVVAAIVGAAGLPSTLAAARAGKRLLLANKESLVLAGELLMRPRTRGGATMLPVDSEHNAIFQCLPPRTRADCARSGVRRMLLTASGGPFRGRRATDWPTSRRSRPSRIRTGRWGRRSRSTRPR